MYSNIKYLSCVAVFYPEAVSHQLEETPRRFEAILSDVDAAIEACECFEGGSPRETQYEIRRQMSRLRLLNVEV